jgi:hypothetical protein
MILYFRLVAKPLASHLFGHLCARMNLERLKPGQIGTRRQSSPQKRGVAVPDLICQDLDPVPVQFTGAAALLSMKPEPEEGASSAFLCCCALPFLRLDSSFQRSGHRSGDTFTKRVRKGAAALR